MGQTSYFNTWRYLQTWPKLILQNKSSCAGNLVKRHGTAGSWKPSVSFSRFCNMPSAWQYFGWKRGKEWHQVKCSKGKSCLPGNRLIPSWKLQTHTLRNSSEENPESPETEILGEPMMSRDVTHWPCTPCAGHKVLGSLQMFKTPALGYCISLHFTAELL